MLHSRGLLKDQDGDFVLVHGNKELRAGLLMEEHHAPTHQLEVRSAEFG